MTIEYGKRTFSTKKVTNDDIYEKLTNLETSMMAHVQEDRKSFASIRSKVKLNYWIAGTSLTLIILVIGIILKLGHN